MVAPGWPGPAARSIGGEPPVTGGRQGDAPHEAPSVNVTQVVELHGPAANRLSPSWPLALSAT